jgi:hypothetical protein
MKWRVTLRVESLDGRILPSGTSGAIDRDPPSSPGLGSKPGGVGDGIQAFGSKPGVISGADDAANKGIELFGGSKPATNGGSN